MPHNTPTTAIHPGSVQVLRAADLEAIVHFVSRLDAQTRNQRFCGHTTAAAAAAHYRGLDWDAAVILAWVAQSEIQGLCDIHLYDAHDGREAEIAFCLSISWRGRGVGLLLLAAAAEEAARRDTIRSVIVLAGPQDTQAEAALALGGSVDPELGIAILHNRTARDRSPEDTMAAGRPSPRNGFTQIAAMMAAVVGGALFLGAAGVSPLASGEPRPATLTAGGDTTTPGGGHTEFHCDILPSAGCACSAESGALSIPLGELLSLPAKAGSALQRQQANWRRQCGVTTDLDTAP